MDAQARGAVAIREAGREDLEAIVALLADDMLGARRERPETPLAPCYLEAFEAMRRQEGNHLLVAVDGDTVLGCVQLTLVPGLSRQGMTRAQIESVRVASAARGRGIGEIMIRACVERARAAGCGVIQLTSDKSREDAQRFYARLGFEATHVGMKMMLE